MRKFIAILISKLIIFYAHLRHRNSSAKPGEIAMKIAPNIIEKLCEKINKDIIVVTGTNGKTTTNNLIYHALNREGNCVAANKYGSNMSDGIATALIEKCTIFGKMKANCACFEVDEAYAAKLFTWFNPDYFVVTNLFEDQIDRFGSFDNTYLLLQKAIKKIPTATLILNADDPYTSSLSLNVNNKIVYYGMDHNIMPGEGSGHSTLCLNCQTVFDYTNTVYSQFGAYVCGKCGFAREKTGYTMTAFSFTDDRTSCTINGTHLVTYLKGVYNLYNVLAAYAALCEVGAEETAIVKAVESFSPPECRMQEFKLRSVNYDSDIGLENTKPRSFILNISKNAASFNQSISTLLRDLRKKDVVIIVSDKDDVSYLFDVDFARLRDEMVNKVYIVGLRLPDLALQFKYMEIVEYTACGDIRDKLDEIMKSSADVCYVIANYTAAFPLGEILQKMEVSALPSNEK